MCRCSAPWVFCFDWGVFFFGGCARARSLVLSFAFWLVLCLRTSSQTHTHTRTHASGCVSVFLCVFSLWDTTCAQSRHWHLYAPPHTHSTHPYTYQCCDSASRVQMSSLYLFIVRHDVRTIATLTFVCVCAVCVRGAGGVQELRERMRSVKVVATTWVVFPVDLRDEKRREGKTVCCIDYLSIHPMCICVIWSGYE